MQPAGSCAHQASNRSRRIALAVTTRPPASTACTWMTRFARSMPTRAILSTDFPFRRFQIDFNTSILALDAVSPIAGSPFVFGRHGRPIGGLCRPAVRRSTPTLKAFGVSRNQSWLASVALVLALLIWLGNGVYLPILANAGVGFSGQRTSSSGSSYQGRSRSDLHATPAFDPATGRVAWLYAGVTAVAHGYGGGRRTWEVIDGIEGHAFTVLACA